jgi:hypothetical protein
MNDSTLIELIVFSLSLSLMVSCLMVCENNLDVALVRLPLVYSWVFVVVVLGGMG